MVALLQLPSVRVSFRHAVSVQPAHGVTPREMKSETSGERARS